MSDDALAYLVEAFGDVSDAELQRFLDAAPITQQPHTDLRELAFPRPLLTEGRETAQAALA